MLFFYFCKNSSTKSSTDMTNITIRPVDNITDPAITSIHRLYHESFPKEERRPWELLTGLIESHMPYFKLFAAQDSNGCFVGFISRWTLPGAYYIEHFAVEQDRRSNGAGGCILDNILQDSSDRPVVLEVELPEANADAPRRIAFYNRHGFKAMDDFVYFQPPYAPGLPDVQLMLMTTKPLDDPRAFTVMLHTLVYNQ